MPCLPFKGNERFKRAWSKPKTDSALQALIVVVVIVNDNDDDVVEQTQLPETNVFERWSDYSNTLMIQLLHFSLSASIKGGRHTKTLDLRLLGLDMLGCMC